MTTGMELLIKSGPTIEDAKKEGAIMEWLSAGYKRFELRDNALSKSADFGLQKLFRDDTGKRYYITVYVYDRTRYPGYPWQDALPEPYGLMPTTQFNVGEEDSYARPFFNIEMNGKFTVTEAEEWFNKLWELFGKPYYSKDE